MEDLHDELPDETLMELIKTHNHDAFAILVKRHSPGFYRLAYRYLLNKGDAEDVTQNAFLKIWNKPHLWDGNRNTKFTTWFYRLIVNSCFDNNKKQKTAYRTNIEVGQNTAFETEYDTRIDTDHMNETEDRYLKLEAGMRSLPERQRMALNLCFAEGLRNKEAAAAMNINLKALESLISRGKHNLKKQLGQGIK